MFKYKKTILLSSVFLLIIGLILSFIAFSLTGFNVYALDLCGEPQEIQYTAKNNEIKSLEIKLYNDKLQIRSSSEIDSIRLTYYTTDCCPVVAEESGDTLSLYYNISSFEYGLKQLTKGMAHGLAKSEKTTLIEIPENQNIELNVSTQNGEVDISDISLSSKIHIDTSNGRIIAQNIESKTAEIYTSNGNITAQNIKAENTKVQTSNGTIYAQNIQSDKLSLETSNGELQLKNITADKLTGYTSNGGITISNVEAEDIICVTSNGSITTDNNKGRHIELGTSNGNISGTLNIDPNEFVVTSSTSNGSNNLSYFNSDGENVKNDSSNTLNVYTSNGDIHIKFPKEFSK